MRSALDLSSKRDNRRPQRTKYRSSRNNEAKGFTVQPIVECRRLVHFEYRPHGQMPTSVLGPATTTTLAGAAMSSSVLGTTVIYQVLATRSG